MDDQPIHPDGEFDQVDFECDRRYWRVVVARKRIWIVPLHVPRPRRIANAIEETALERHPSRLPESSIERKTCAT